MPQEPLKILLIEHDPGFARYVGEMLGQARELSAEVQSAADLAHGLWELQSAPCSMPCCSTSMCPTAPGWPISR